MIKIINKATNKRNPKLVPNIGIHPININKTSNVITLGDNQDGLPLHFFNT